MRDVDTSYAIRKGGVCVTHGAVGNKRCSHKGCTYSARKGGVCVTHGAVVSRCSHKGCIKSARNGGVCTTHGAERKRCSHEGCPNQVVKGGVCITHGATKKRKRCSHKGCTNHVVKMEECVSLMAHRNRSENVVATRDVQTKPKRVGKVCITHGAKAKVQQCSRRGCTSNVRKGGVCNKHPTKSSINAITNPTLQTNTDVTPVIPSCQSINYEEEEEEEEEEELNSWIWKSSRMMTTVLYQIISNATPGPMLVVSSSIYVFTKPRNG